MESDRLDRLDLCIAEGRLIRGLRGQWWREADGKFAVDLLTALAPECNVASTVAVCPPEVMPVWLAELTLFINDSGTDEHWPAVVRRYAALARRWGALDAGAWRRLDYACRAVAVRELISHIGAGERGAIDDALEMLDRVSRGSDDDVYKTGDGGVVVSAMVAVKAAAVATVVMARAAVATAAADRIIDGVLDAIEREIEARVGNRK
jgi:hypothetical protein